MSYGYPALLALADGTVFRGRGFGYQPKAHNPILGEVVFNTSMYGYQEILTDPSYAGQILCFSYPHIGNVGCNKLDNESEQIHAEALLCRNYPTPPSNFRSEISLEEFLYTQKKMGFCEFDTRALILHLRDHGAQMGALGASDDISADELIACAKAAGSMAGKEYVSKVSCKKSYQYRSQVYATSPTSPHVVCVDCGVKIAILELLCAAGFKVTVVPYNTTVTEVLALAPQGLFLSNGPGDPATLGGVVAMAKAILGVVPIFGICLGHQILGQALGAKTYKLPFGHRGANHPVLDKLTGKISITVQNHGFAVDEKTIPTDSGAQVSHINLNDGTVEGLIAPHLKAFSVQYHPESSPGPHDARYLFKDFYQLVKDSTEVMHATTK